MAGELRGWGALIGNLDTLIEYYSSEALPISHAELLAVANEIAEAARIYAPVKTGQLKAGVQVVDAGETIEIHSLAPYSLFVEYGTIRTAAQPFLRPAYEEYRIFATLAEKHWGEIRDRLQSA